MSFIRWLRFVRSSLTTGRINRKHRRSAKRGLRGYRPQLEALEDRCLLSFSSAVVYQVGAITEAVVSADFNNDSILDLAVANHSGLFSNVKNSNVSVLLGNADGTFQPALNSATGTQPVSLAVGDFNDDGKLDLATANSYHNDVSVLLGNGNGTFQAPTNTGTVGTPASMAVGDFNADGDLDLGVTIQYRGGDYYGNYAGGYANVLLGHGDGSFAAPVGAWLGSAWHTSGAVADFNGDGNLDFAAVGATIDVVFGDGTGAFGSPVAILVGSTPYSVAAGDVNADGNVDLVAATYGNNVSVVLGNGLGDFEAAQNYPVGASPSSVALADFNRDGKVDLVTANEVYDGTASVLLGDGTGAFGVAEQYAVGTEPLWVPEPRSVAVGDFNGDLFPDLAVANERSDNVSVLLNNGIWPAFDAPTIAIRAVTVTEGNNGTVNAGFKITLSAPYNQTVTVEFATADATATVAGGDYQAKSKTVTFLAGQTTKTVNVLVNGDRIDEGGGEAFYARLSNATNAFITDATALCFILDDEPRVSISGWIFVTEGDSGASNAVFTVRLEVPYDLPVSVNYSTFEGDTAFLDSYWGPYGYYEAPPHATADSDFQAVEGTITFAPGETVKTIPIVIYGDQLSEVNEYFSVNLTSADGGAIYGAHAVGIIGNDEERLSINSVSLKEGNRGTKVMTFTVTLAAASERTVTVNYVTYDSSATAGEDYVPTSGTLTFTPGQTSKTISVTIKGDRKKEADESFYILLSDASDALIDKAYGWGTILNDER